MISKDDIEHLKDLARTEFGEHETRVLAKDLNSILEYVATLQQADVSNVPEMTYALKDVKNITRPDEDICEEGISKSITDAFPQKERDYLKVKAVL